MAGREELRSKAEPDKTAVTSIPGDFGENFLGYEPALDPRITLSAEEAAAATEIINKGD